MKNPGYILAFVGAAATLAACAPNDPANASARSAAAAQAKPRAAYYVPVGTNLDLVLETTISSKTSRSGDRVDARLASDLRAGERLVAPAGSAVRGHVTAAVPAGHVKGRARLAFDFDTLIVGGREQPIEARAVDITAANSHKRDGVIIGGGAGAGAIVGALVGGKKGAGIGALLGAGAGTGVVLTNTGKEVLVPAGATISVELTQATRIIGG
jgi:hypothetical protein